jgi:ribonuclease HII
VGLLNFHTKGIIEAGCDEAGRGCLAGPVVAAAVILPKRFTHKALNDSKKMSLTERNELRLMIEQKALAWAVGIVDHEKIDEINILNASFLAMHRAIAQLKTIPESLLIDGNRFNPYEDISHHCIIKGDGKYKSIAAASVLAKTHRDEIMENLHQEYPYYKWDSNKGYPTKVHREAIRTHGVSPHHRKSFKQLPEQYSLFS